MEIKREIRIHDMSRCYGASSGIVFHFMNDPTGLSSIIPMGEIHHPNNSFNGCMCKRCISSFSANQVEEIPLGCHDVSPSRLSVTQKNLVHSVVKNPLERVTIESKYSQKYESYHT